MAKIDGVQEVSVDLLKPYERNARMHSDAQIKQIADSIREFGFLNPCLIDRENNLIAGHGRLAAAKSLGMKTVPCIYAEGLTEAQRRAYILADNRLAETSEWNQLILDEELDWLVDEDFDISIAGFDLDTDQADWFQNRERWDDSTEGESDEYKEFLEKFEDPKTTDDCYTPDNIYEVVAEYVANRYQVKRRNFVRPFYPGGDYQNEKYGKNAVVVDNPPFSILSEIVHFYVDNGIKFFLFAPAMTLLHYSSLATVMPTGTQVIYENGAMVPTGFLTNMEPGNIAIMTTPDLREEMDKANEENAKKLKKELPKYSYPDEVVTSPMMNRWGRYGVEQAFTRDESVLIDALDAQKEAGKSIYGKGLLLSERAAAERAAAERAAAERAAAMKWQLSDREKEIVKSLGEEK
ncbi:MAG: ParB N-terminal domain-containing protein [Mogibacterium sp.]|nr:ParB N-terminal domain-containing protein [Mogibacterium sp.]MBR2801719.1 ParB N-terminal domain-containing protein [Erysipelotrichaceae bacterium]